MTTELQQPTQIIEAAKAVALPPLPAFEPRNDQALFDAFSQRDVILALMADLSKVKETQLSTQSYGKEARKHGLSLKTARVLLENLCLAGADPDTTGLDFGDDLVRNITYEYPTLLSTFVLGDEIVHLIPDEQRKESVIPPQEAEKIEDRYFHLTGIIDELMKAQTIPDADKPQAALDMLSFLTLVSHPSGIEDQVDNVHKKPFSVLAAEVIIKHRLGNELRNIIAAEPEAPIPAAQPTPDKQALPAPTPPPGLTSPPPEPELPAPPLPAVRGDALKQLEKADTQPEIGVHGVILTPLVREGVTIEKDGKTIRRPGVDSLRVVSGKSAVQYKNDIPNLFAEDALTQTADKNLIAYRGKLRQLLKLTGIAYMSENTEVWKRIQSSYKLINNPTTREQFCEAMRHFRWLVEEKVGDAVFPEETKLFPQSENDYQIIHVLFQSLPESPQLQLAEVSDYGLSAELIAGIPDGHTNDPRQTDTLLEFLLLRQLYSQPEARKALKLDNLLAKIRK